MAKHIAAGHGKETEKSLHDKASDADLDAHELFDSGEHIAARGMQRVADHYDEILHDMKDAKRSIKEYGSGHDMTHNGEGKRYGEA